MEVEDMKLEDKCEHLMNIVVESRKRFGKMCIDYKQKTSLVENKMLNLQIETITNYRFKPKSTIPEVNIEEMTNEAEEFKDAIKSTQNRLQTLRQNVKNTQKVVLQLKTDDIGHRLRKPIRVETMVADAKNKIKL